MSISSTRCTRVFGAKKSRSIHDFQSSRDTRSRRDFFHSKAGFDSMDGGLLIAKPR